jgi:hypothetical protein
VEMFLLPDDSLLVNEVRANLRTCVMLIT